MPGEQPGDRDQGELEGGSGRQDEERHGEERLQHRLPAAHLLTAKFDRSFFSVCFSAPPDLSGVFDSWPARARVIE